MITSAEREGRRFRALRVADGKDTPRDSAGLRMVK